MVIEVFGFCLALDCGRAHSYFREHSLQPRRPPENGAIAITAFRGVSAP